MRGPSTNVQEAGPSGFADPAVASGRHRPYSSMSSKPHPTGGNGVDSEHGHAKSTHETKGTGKGNSRLQKELSLDTVRGRGNGDVKAGASSSTTKPKENVERRLKTNHDAETSRASSDAPQEYYSHPGHARGTSKASKTPTPVSSTFPEMARSRSGRGTAGGGGSGGVDSTSKRPRKKSLSGGGASSTVRGENRPGTSGGTTQYASASTVTAVGTSISPGNSAAFATKAVIEGVDSTNPGDDGPEGDNTNNKPEKRYCICNDYSYGSMVACDGETCSGEWFHWKCVGLKAEPTGSE